MIRVSDNMPAGTIGLEAVGRVTAHDYGEVLGPAVHGAASDAVPCASPAMDEATAFPW
jgi:hypothetical protein